ncbi:MAG: hypothetical protein ACJ79S_14440 [Gemmatimonadaceae bacterium]
MLDRLFAKIDEWRTASREVRGVPVVVRNTRPDIDTGAVFARLDAALALIERYQPHHFRRLRRDFAQILVVRYPCRGAWLPEQRTCLVELTFSVNPEFSDAQVAATILHEAMHARLDRMGLSYEGVSRARHERFCRRAELEFGQLVPDGEPVVARALQSLAESDEAVAPVVDWELASHRVNEADLAALDAPRWLKRVVARRRGLEEA